MDSSRGLGKEARAKEYYLLLEDLVVAIAAQPKPESRGVRNMEVGPHRGAWSAGLRRDLEALALRVRGSGARSLRQP